MKLPKNYTTELLFWIELVFTSYQWRLWPCGFIHPEDSLYLHGANRMLKVNYKEGKLRLPANGLCISTTALIGVFISIVGLVSCSYIKVVIIHRPLCPLFCLVETQLCNPMVFSLPWRYCICSNRNLYFTC
jgi:hypothetical protein